MAMRLVARQTAMPFVLNNVQVLLLARALQALGAHDSDLIAPDAYVPSHIAQDWGQRLITGVSELRLIEAWNHGRYQLIPVGVERAPQPQVPGRRRRGPQEPTVPPPEWVERTPVMDSPLGATLWAFAQWCALSGGFTVAARPA